MKIIIFNLRQMSFQPYNQMIDRSLLQSDNTVNRPAPDWTNVSLARPPLVWFLYSTVPLLSPRFLPYLLIAVLLFHSPLLSYLLRFLPRFLPSWPTSLFLNFSTSFPFLPSFLSSFIQNLFTSPSFCLPYLFLLPPFLPFLVLFFFFPPCRFYLLLFLTPLLSFSWRLDGLKPSWFSFLSEFYHPSCPSVLCEGTGRILGVKHGQINSFSAEA